MADLNHTIVTPNSSPLRSNDIIAILDPHDTPKGDRSKSYGRIDSISYELMVNVVDLILHKVHYHLIFVIIRLDFAFPLNSSPTS